MGLTKPALENELKNSAAPIERSISGASAQSAALPPGAYIITADEDCYFLQGANPTATTSSRKLWASTYRRIDVKKVGEDDKIAVIGTSGTLSIERVQ